MKFFTLTNLMLNPKHIVSILLEDNTITITNIAEIHTIQYVSIEEAKEVMAFLEDVLL